MQCSSYRSISLIGVDVKIYFMLIATCLQPLLPHRVHMDQVGFVQGREAHDNTLKTILLMGRAQTVKILACLLSVDAEKAFDRVGWPFREQTLAQIGFGPNILHKILALYSRPSAKIRINGSQTSNFSIHNGTRQRCPLSPLLFVLVMEHLAIALRQNLFITVIQIDK